jgi:hypothetical protein
MDGLCVCPVFTEKNDIGKNKRAIEVVDRVAVGDDKDGMDRETLHNTLKLVKKRVFNALQ